MLRPDNLTGKTIGKYKVERKIGRGGMAHVYLAQDTTLLRQVAIKVLDASRAMDEQLVARFEREARISAQLDHPNIVTVYEVGKANGLIFIAMEYVQGKTLKDILDQTHKAGKVLDPAYTVQIIQQVADALSYAYETKQVVHRDIKPVNILVAPNNRVKLTDFGIARAIKEETLTSGSSHVGTPFYMSPEHFNTGKLDHRSDIYSLGVVLYQMIVNRSGPFGVTPSSVPALMAKHISEPPIPPRKINPNISPQVEAVILKALEKDPNRRFQTAREMAQALAQLYTTSPKGVPTMLKWGIPVLIVLAVVALCIVGSTIAYLARNKDVTPTTVPETIAAGSEDATPTATLETIAQDNGDTALTASARTTVHLRVGPDHIYDELMIIEENTMLTVEAISQDDRWLRVQAPDGTIGWSPVANLDLSGVDLSLIPVAVVIPPTPTPAVDSAASPSPASDATSVSVTASPTATTPESRPSATSTLMPSPTSVPTAKPTSRPQLKPDRVVFVQSSGDSHYLGLVSPDGELLEGRLHDFAAAPVWSPDGGQIAFFGEEGISQLGGDYSAGNGLWILDMEQRDQKPPWRLVEEDHIKNISWSPDGTKIAYQVTPPGQKSNIVIVEAQTGKEISRYPGEEPTWGPDGQKLAVKTCAPECGLWMVNFDGGNAEQITFDGTDSYPNWSDTGRLTFSSNRDNNWEIYILDLDTNNITRVTNRPATDVTPVFSRDGREIYLRTDHFGGWRVTAINLNSGDERTVREGVGKSNDWGLARPAVY